MAAAPTTVSSPALVWVDRGRFVLAIALVWTGLHFVAGPFLSGGLDRPLVLATSPVGGVLVVMVLAAGGALARVLGAAPHPRRVLMISGVALAVWAAEGGRAGGTMDTWLILRHPDLGPPTGGPYWLLLADYLYLALGIGGAGALARQLGRARRAAEVVPQPARAGRPAAFGLLVSIVVAGIAVVVLAGRPLGQTLRGQVYFAAGVGLLFGVWAAMHVTQVRAALWYAPAPFILGLVGLAVAGISPGLMLPPEYRNLDILPAWGLSRALPIEMVGAGLVGAMWLLPAESAALDEP
jgi:hypothetical protein